MWNSIIFPKSQQSNLIVLFHTCNPFGGLSLLEFLRLYGGYHCRRGNISELAFGYSDSSSCLLSSAASGWCWWKTELLNLCMNCTDALRKQKTVLLRVCGRFDGAVCVWGFQGTDTCPGLENETHQRRRHSAPQNILCLLSREEGKNRSRFISDKGGRVCGSTSFCQVMGTLSVLNLA